MEMSDNMPATPKEYLRSMGILHKAIVIGAVLFAIVAFAVIQFNGGGVLSPADSKKTGVVFLIVSAVLATICFFRAYTSYNKSIDRIKNGEGNLLKKLNQYHSALILYLALCEGGTLFSIIVFFLTGDYKALIITGLMAAAMIVKAPVQKKIADELGLDWKEQQQF